MHISNPQNTKNTTKFGPKSPHFNKQPCENKQKGGKKKEGNLPKPLPSFFFFRPLLSLLPAIIYINKKIKTKLLADVSLLFQHPLQDRKLL